MALKVYPAHLGAADTQGMSQWLRQTGAEPHADWYGYMPQTSRTRDVWTLHNENNNLLVGSVNFYGLGLSNGIQLGQCVLYKQGYVIENTSTATLSTANLSLDKHYMLCLTIDLTRSNSSSGLIKDNSYAVNFGQVYLEAIEYNPDAPIVWGQPPHMKAAKDLNSPVASQRVSSIMLADINTDSAIIGDARQVVTMLDSTYEYRKATKHQGKKLIYRTSSNASYFPQRDLVHIGSGTSGQSKVMGGYGGQVTDSDGVTIIPKYDDAPTNRIFFQKLETGSEGSGGKSGAIGLQKVPFIYTSYPQQPYTAGVESFSYDPNKSWTNGLKDRIKGTQPPDFLAPIDEATFKVHRGGLYRFDVRVVLQTPKAAVKNSRWNGIEIVVRRGSQAPAGMRQVYSIVWSNVENDNLTAIGAKTRQNGWGFMDAHDKQFNAAGTVQLFVGDEVSVCLFTNSELINNATGGSGRVPPQTGVQALLNMQDFDIYYMEDNIITGYDQDGVPIFLNF